MTTNSKTAARLGLEIWSGLGRLLSALVILAIRVYQLTLGPIFFHSACRFRPTCSQYMIEALRKYGLARGLAKGVGRVLRCHPWNPGGDDPP
jgi:putative membrane protein insertion efficiency factor